MKNDKLFDAIGWIDDDLIEDAENEKVKVRVIDFSRARRCALPAAAIFVVCVGLYSLQGIMFMGGSSSSCAEDAELESAAATSEEDNSIDEFDYVNAEPETDETADEDDSFILGASCGETAEETTADVPMLFVNGVAAYVGSWSRDTLVSGGEWQSDISDSASVLECEGLLPVIAYDGTIGLESDTEMTFTAYCYSEGSYGSENAVKYSASAENGELTLPDDKDSWIVVVVGTWNDENDRGQCEYYFEAVSG